MVWLGHLLFNEAALLSFNKSAFLRRRLRESESKIAGFAV
jgi:hypothetical protein